MDALRERFAAARADGRLIPLLVGVGVALAILIGAVVVTAGQASGSTAEVPVTRTTATAPVPTPLLVHVSGAVRRPGLVSLPAGSRVVDAIAAAGGAAHDADQSAVNLAARLADGQQVVLPAKGAPRAAPGAAAPSTGALVSLGTATVEQLETLPRIGPSMAARIIAYRDAHGGFSSVDELGEVSGIGPKTLAGLRDLVTP